MGKKRGERSCGAPVADRLESEGTKEPWLSRRRRAVSAASGSTLGAPLSSCARTPRSSPSGSPSAVPCSTRGRSPPSSRGPPCTVSSTRRTHHRGYEEEEEGRKGHPFPCHCR